MMRFLLEATARRRTSRAPPNEVAIPLTTLSGLPVFMVSTVFSRHGTPTFFLMRSITSPAVIGAGWAKAREVAREARRKVLRLTCMRYPDDILKIAMTKVQLRYDLMRPLDDLLMEQIARVHTVYGIV